MAFTVYFEGLKSVLKEMMIPLKGRQIAAKIWHAENGIPTLALHGWLDNAASFDYIAPLLPELHIVALDLPGHGHSDHQPPGTSIHFIDFATTAIEVANYLGWDKFALLGHSLGACIHSVIAGALTSRIQWLGLIDGLGPLTTPAEHTPLQFRLFIDEMIAKPNKMPPSYPTQEDAMLARLKVSAMHPSSAKVLIERGTKQLPDGQWTWRTDPRLLMPSPLHLTEEQALAFLSAITAPVCVIRPEPGYPFPLQIMQRRIKALQDVQVFRIQGDHHVHLDAPLAVAECIKNFLTHIIVK